MVKFTQKNDDKNNLFASLDDIEKELKHYKEHFKNKIVFCNAGDGEQSNFLFFFRHNFIHYDLKKLICLDYNENGKATKIEIFYNSEKKITVSKEELNENGSFNGENSLNCLKESDIVVTFPSFDLFNDYINLVLKYEKKFLFLSNLKTSKLIIELIKENKIWCGVNNNTFETFENNNGNFCWYTNMDHFKRKRFIELTNEYDQNTYPKYLQYDAINVDKIKRIPNNYSGLMGVPLTFFYHYNPDQFEIIDYLNGSSSKSVLLNLPAPPNNKTINDENDKNRFARVVIRNKSFPNIDLQYNNQKNFLNEAYKNKMSLQFQFIKIKDLIAGFDDKSDENDDYGIYAYYGKLNIRPAYQREMIYSNKEQNQIIDSILKNYPINLIYWAKTGNDTYEVIDGQQRIMSICNFYNHDFSYKVDNIIPQYFDNLSDELKNKFLNYELMVYIIENGDETEKLNWFKIINTPGKKLSKQELRNAFYTGLWLSDAKKYFSKLNGLAQKKSKGLIKGDPKRQEILEKALEWIADKQNCSVEEYMNDHRKDSDAQELWIYFQQVIDWVRRIFVNEYEEMQKVEWGKLYNEFGDNNLNPKEIGSKIQVLMEHPDIQKKEGIFSYVLDKKEHHLNLRIFDNNQKRIKYQKQKGFCASCNKKFLINQMQADHIIPWSQGGSTVLDNLQMLCIDCNRRKSNKFY